MIISDNHLFGQVRKQQTFTYREWVLWAVERQRYVSCQHLVLLVQQLTIEDTGTQLHNQLIQYVWGSVIPTSPPFSPRNDFIFNISKLHTIRRIMRTIRVRTTYNVQSDCIWQLWRKYSTLDPILVSPGFCRGFVSDEYYGRSLLSKT